MRPEHLTQINHAGCGQCQYSTMKTADLIARYDGRLPRYTSYPTAPHFGPAVTPEIYGSWLSDLPDSSVLSIYLHVPFCDRLCFYCGCNTSVVRREGPRRDYADLTVRELDLVASQIGRRLRVGHIHWGGGTPTTLPADCLVRIMKTIRTRFDVLPGAEVAIEIDPTELPLDRITALSEMGVTRVSLGVQDFNPAVQSAIGRFQSFDTTKACADALRGLGIASLNLDLIYGLPNQTQDSVAQTARSTLLLNADRIAVFGYAHVPWMKRHQSLIDEASLPDAEARFGQRDAIDRVLQDEGGYQAIGLDHYARPHDAMAQAAGMPVSDGGLRRSFQGYTTDTATALIGIGASAIGSLPQGYVQNLTAVPAYADAIKSGGFAIAKGIALTADDRLRRDVIERLMCDLEVDLDQIANTHPMGKDFFDNAFLALRPFEADGLASRKGGRIIVQEAGRPFVRNIAAIFDAYLTKLNSPARHARAV
jgi:oxygen-independent coproporphyrinogen-3 oxidase